MDAPERLRQKNWALFAVLAGLAALLFTITIIKFTL
jgi:hypothetical protein